MDSPTCKRKTFTTGGTEVHRETQGKTILSVILCAPAVMHFISPRYRTELSNYDIHQLPRNDDDLYYLFACDRSSHLLISKRCLFNLILVSAC